QGLRLSEQLSTARELAAIGKVSTFVLHDLKNQVSGLSLMLDNARDYIDDPEFQQDMLETVGNTVVNMKALISRLKNIKEKPELVIAAVPLDKIIARLCEVDITAPPGKLYGYQNVVYSIYGPIVSAETDKSFNTLLKEKVFIPFGMEDASTGFDAFKNDNNKAYPHFNQGKNRYKSMRLNDRYYNTSPAAGINASISDLGQFLITLTDDSSKCFSNSARETVFTPQVNSPLKRMYFRSWDKVQSKQYAIGWRLIDYKGRKVAYHGGFVSGYKAEIAFCEKEDIGIAILTNSPNNLTSKTIPTFLNMLFEYKDNLALENSSETEMQVKP
ncbi:MAG: serine hydrolase, partial [Draconibacterium sp.]|nr:serine hydrolase [Draconibacterium sp.]